MASKIRGSVVSISDIFLVNSEVPNYYFTLTYVPNKEGKDIQYIDSDRLSYLFSWWHIVTGKRGVFYLKRRQSGKSIELGANLLWLSCLVGDENFALQSMNDEKLRVLYSTCFQGFVIRESEGI